MMTNTKPSSVAIPLPVPLGKLIECHTCLCASSAQPNPNRFILGDLLILALKLSSIPMVMNIENNQLGRGEHFVDPRGFFFKHV